jgi:hypothetical protein
VAAIAVPLPVYNRRGFAKANALRDARIRRCAVCALHSEQARSRTISAADDGTALAGQRAMTRRAAVVACILCLASMGTAGATPTGNVWAPTSPGVQGFGVLHLTYDSYFAPDALYPIDLGVTAGVLPWPALQLEVGIDLLFPTFDAGGERLAVPIQLNAKLGGAEDLYFDGQPAWAVGIYGVGLESDVNNANIVTAVVGKSNLPYVGSLSIGGYVGLNADLMRSSDGEVNRAGFLAGWFSPAIEVPLIDRIHLSADVQTGENAAGAAGAAVYLYLTPSIDLVTGPILLFDRELQPEANRWAWTVQLDVDLDLDPDPDSPPELARRNPRVP